MGSQQSTAANLFEYPCCCPYVTEFIKTHSEHSDELKRLVQNYASISSIYVESGIGKIMLQPNMVSNASEDAAKQECRQILDKYFQNYSSFEECSQNLTISSHHQIDNIIKRFDFHCIRDKSAFDKIRITGVRKDVKELIKNLRKKPDIQNVPSSSTLASAQPSSRVSSPQPLVAKFSTVPTSSSNSNVAHVTQSTTIPQLVQPQITSKQLSSKNSRYSSVDSASTKRLSRFDASNSQTEDTSISENIIKNPLIRGHMFKLPAPDASIARFIKYSDSHRSNLQGCFGRWANTTVWENKSEKKLEYHFRLNFSCSIHSYVEDFDDDCKTIALKFLEKFFSRKHRFKQGQFMKVTLRHPEYFSATHSRRKDDVFVRWHRDEHFVIIVGLKSDVDAKEREIVNFFDSVALKFYEFEVEPSDLAVAEFLLNNPIHRSVLKNSLGDNARASIRSEKFSISIRSTYAIYVEDIPAFVKHCKNAVDSVFAQYMSWRKTYTAEIIQNLFAKQPQLYNDREGNVDVKCCNDVELLIVGKKGPVFAKKAAITKAILSLRAQQQPHNYTHKLNSVRIGNFIRNSPKHGKLFEEHVMRVTGAFRVTVTNPEPNNSLVNFFVKVQTAEEKAAFEEKCKLSLNFLKNYSTSTVSFPSVALNVACAHGFDPLNCWTDDVMIDVLDKSAQGDVKFFIIGLKEVVELRKQHIVNSMEEFVSVSFRPPQQNTRYQSTSSNHAARLNLPPNLRPSFIYQPPIKHFKDIMTHVFKTPIELNALRRSFPPFVQFIPYPSLDNLTRIHFFFQGSQLRVSIPQIMKKFLQNFDVLLHDAGAFEQTMLRINEVRSRHELDSTTLAVHREDDVIKVIGPKFAVNELSSMLKGRSRSNSTSSTSSASTPRRRVRNRTRRPSSTASEISRPAENNQDFSIIYKPKRKFSSLLDLVLKNESLFEVLERKYIDDLEFSGCSSPLTIVPRDTKKYKNKQQFVNEAIKMMESFLGDLVTEQIHFEANILPYLKDNESNLFDSTKDEPISIVLEWDTDSVIIKGLSEDVEKYKNILINEISKEESCPRNVCRALIACGLLDKVNEKFSGKIEVSCSEAKEKIYFKGPAFFIDSALKELRKEGQIIEEVPKLSSQKLELLNSLFARETKDANLTLINKKLIDNHIKGVLLLDSDKITLAAQTRKMFEDGSKLLDDMVKITSIEHGGKTSQDAFSKEKWSNIVKEATSDHVIIEVQDDSVKVMGIDWEELKRSTACVKKYLLESSSVVGGIQCSSHISKFIIRHYSSNNTLIPDSIKMEAGNGKVNVSGPRCDVKKVVDFFRTLDWEKKTQSFSAPTLPSYFTTESWRAFVTVLENDTRCVISYEGNQDTTQQRLEREETFPTFSSQSPFYQSAGDNKETKYENVSVSVCRGDITKDDCNVIINGATSDFNLSRGTVSSALLQRAGNKMQEECKNNPVYSTPILRCTHGWNLLCDYVIHLVTPHTLTDLTKRIYDALDYAEMLGATSVALPTLGAGAIGLDSSGVASSMSEAFDLFASEQPHQVKMIKVVVFEPSLVPEFERIIVSGKEIMNYGDRKLKMLQSRVKSAVVPDKVDVVVYSDDTKDFDQITQKLTDHMSKHVITKTICDSVFSRLGDHDWIDIYQASIQERASVVFDQLKLEINLQGLSENVNKLYEIMQEIKYELREAVTSSKIFLWKWAGSSNRFSSLPLRVSLKIEKEYERCSSSTSSVSIYGSHLTVDFSNMTYQFDGSGGKLKRVDSKAEEIPPEWSDIMGKSWIKVELKQNSREYQKVVERFQKSGPNARILKIERVQNPILYKQYLTKKRDVEKHLTSSNPVERELFHGTSSASVNKICADGFNRSYAGKNATVYGKGSYFAVKSAYSVQYAERSSQQTGFLFLAHVLTGDFCKGHSDYIEPPLKLHSGDTTRHYDSVTDNADDPSMFVVFKDSSVYPYYLISFV